MACLESAIFSIDLDDDHIDDIMYQEGGGKMEAQAVAIKKKLLKIAVNSVKKMKTQMDEAEAKQKKLLETAVNSVKELKTQMDEANKKGNIIRKEEGERERREREKQREIEAKNLLLSGVFKTAVKMKEKSDVELLKSLSQKVADIFLSSGTIQNNKKKNIYADKCQLHFETKYKEVKLNYPQLYSCLESDDLLNELLHSDDNTTN